MAEQNINFKVTANSKQAEDAFKRIAEAQKGTITASNEMQKTAMGTMTAWRSQNQLGNQFVSTLRSGTMFTQGFSAGIQGLALNLDGLVDQYEKATIRGLSFKDVLKQSVMGVSGFSIAITAVVTGITLFTNWLGKQKSETELATEALRKHREELEKLRDKYNEFEKKAKDPATFMRAVTRGELGKLQEAKISLESQILSLSKIKGGTDAEKFSRALLLSKLKQDLDDVNARLEIINASFRNIKESIKDSKNIVNNTTDNLEKQKATIGFISVLYENILSTMETMSRINPLQQSNKKFEFQGQVSVPNKPTPSILISEAELKEYNAFLYTTMTATAYSVGDTFKQMWRDVFGEANNLLTDFIGNIINSLIDLAARGLAVDLLNLVFPGAGLLGGLGLFGSQQPATLPSASGTLSKSTNVYNINIGNQTVAQVVTEGYNTAVRLRKL